MEKDVVRDKTDRFYAQFFFPHFFFIYEQI